MSKPFTPTAHDRAVYTTHFIQRRNDLLACKECRALVDMRDAAKHVDWHMEQKLAIGMLRLTLERKT